MNAYLRVARINHWLKNIFILFGHVVALAPPLQLTVICTAAATATAASGVLISFGKTKPSVSTNRSRCRSPRPIKPRVSRN